MKRLIISFVSIFFIVFASQAATFTVTTGADNGPGTLRQALADVANTGTSGHTIIFSTPMTIILNNSLDIYNDTDFNGLTINGFVDGVAGPDVIIRSNNLCGVRGFNISFALLNAKFYGLVFQNLEYGIFYGANSVATALNSEIKGCYFGTDIAGNSIVNGICKSGVNLEQASSVTIGGIGTTLANGASSASNNSERCVFGGTCNGNTDELHGAIRTSLGANNSIVNNYIGVSADGNTRLVIGDLINRWANVKHGIVVDNSKSNTIDGNVISGAVGCGVYVVNFADNTIIKGNKIGTNAAGTVGYNSTTPANSFGNEACGIYLNRVQNCVIGGSNLGDRNLIAANGGARHVWGTTAGGGNDCGNKAWDYTNQMGIYGESISNNTIIGNYIGTDETGTLSGAGTSNVMYNRAGGIKIIAGNFGSSGNRIGGTGLNDHNVISGHREFWGSKTSQVPGCTAYDLSFVTGGTGIILQSPNNNNNIIISNYIGLAADGISPLGNLISGIELQGVSNTTIGGTTAAERNYICDNRWGIILQENFQAAHNRSASNTIQGNWIGLNKNGIAVGNGVSASANTAGEGGGICLQMGSNNNKIGTAVAGGGNVISGNRSGIVLRNAENTNPENIFTGPSNTNTVYNNIIGLDPNGATAIPNTSTSGGYGYGIQIEIGASGTTIPFANIIGGTLANQANTISGNQKSGIYVNSATAVTASTANSIVGNKIGTNLAGTADLGNTLQGIEIVNVSKTTITSNMISGNDQNGISLTGSSTNTIQSNTIGFGQTAPIPNGANGIFLSASSSNTIQNNTVASNTSNGISLTAGSATNIIGGVSANQPNFINNNGANGVVVDGVASINNSIHKNSFSCNTLRGIVLSPAANGGNNNYAAPTIVGTPTQITFTGPAGSTIEVFETDGCATCATGTSTRLQGKTFITSGPTGATGFAFTTALGFDKTKTYTALAHNGSTTAAHNTSEFSICYTLCTNIPAPTITAGPTTFCAGGSVTLTAVVTGGVGTETYQWRNASGNIVGATNSTYSATTSGTYTVVYNSDQACTPNQSSAGTVVTVNPRPTIADQTPAAICSGTSFTVTPSGAGVPAGTLYTWTAPTGTGFSGGSAQATGQTSISQTLTNTTPTAVATAVYTVTPTSGAGCAGATFTVTVTINPRPAISSPNTASVCSDSPLTYPITSGVASSYIWTRNVVSGITNVAGSGNTSPISETLINATNAAVNVIYTITPTSTTGSCPGTPFTLTVTVNPKPKISSPATGIVCSGSPYNYTITSGAASTYSWTRAIVVGITNGAGSGATNSISETLDNNTNAAVDVTYLITATSTAGTCAGDQFSLKVTVNPKPTVTSLNTAVVCSNTALNYNIASSVASSYSWTRTLVSGISNPTVTSSANPITETLINNTPGSIDVTYAITPTSTTGSCVGSAFSLKVTVNPKPVITSALTDAVCSNAPFTYAITSNTTSSYAWSRDAVTGISNVAATGNSSPISETLVNETNASVVVIYSIIPTSTGGTCLGDEVKVNVTVNPKPVITSDLTANVCSGSPLNYTITSSSTSTYVWTRPLVSGVSPATGSGTSSSITETLTSSAPASVNVSYFIKPTSTANLCAGDAVELIVTINPKPSISSPLTASVCSGSPVNYEITTSSPASYTWTRAQVTDITPATGSGTSSKITEVLVNATLSSVDVVYSITANSTFGCGGDATTVTVTVNPKPTVTVSAGGPLAFCSGESVVLTATPDIAGGTVEWSGGGILWGTANPITVTTDGIYYVKYTAAVTSCVSDSPTGITVTIKPDNSKAFARDSSVVTCLDNIVLVGNKPLFGTGTGAWTIYAPNPALPAELQSIPNRFSDSMQAVNLVTGVSYKFLYTISGACGAPQSDTMYVKVGVDDFGLTATAPSDTLCVQTKRNLTAHVTGTGGSGDYNYVWAGSDGTSVTTKTPMITVSPTYVTTDYVVYVEDLKQIGCKTNEVPLTLNAINGQNLFVPNLITPNGDDKNEIFYLADVTTYPGIQMPLIQEGSYVIVTNRWGNKVFEANNYKNNWNPKDLSDGIYYYQITTTCGNKEYKSWLQILGNKNN